MTQPTTEFYARIGEAVYKAALDNEPDTPLDAAELREYLRCDLDVAKNTWASRILLALADALEAKP